MTNEERDIITRFIERAGGAGAAGGSVPSSQALPPVDPEADALIGQLFQQHPEARYRIAQLAYVQEQALNAAQQRIQALQAQLQQQSQQQSQGASPWGAAAQGGQPAPHRGLLGSLFGSSGGSQAAPPPPPQYQAPPPQYQQPQYAPPPSMMQPQGSGFLGGALRTAAGVAGGLVAGQALMNLFEGGHGGFGGGFGGGGFGGGGFGGPEVVNETVINEPGASNWGGADPMDQGGAPKDDQVAGGGDQGGWQDASNAGGGWQDAQPDAGGGGWQDASSDTGGGGGWDGGGSNADDGGWTDSSSDA